MLGIKLRHPKCLPAKTLVCILLNILSFSTLAQKKGDAVNTFKLKITNSKNQFNTGYLNFTINSPTDTSFKQNVMTDNKGYLHFKIPVKFYLIRLSGQSLFFSLDTAINLRNFPIINNSETDLGVLDVNSNHLNTLKEVSVTGNVNYSTPEKKSYKASSFTVGDLPIGKNLLTKIPGIRFSKDGYLVDGNLHAVFYLNGTQVTQQTIENFPLADIERVEIINNSTLSSDIKADQIIVNIVTKKTPQISFNGIAIANVAVNRKNNIGTITGNIAKDNTFVNLMVNRYSTDIKISNYSNYVISSSGDGIYKRDQNGVNNTSPIFTNLSLNSQLSKKLKINYSFSYNNIDLNQSSSSLIDQFLSASAKSTENLLIAFNPRLINNYLGLTYKVNVNSSYFVRGWYTNSETNTTLNLAIKDSAGIISHIKDQNNDYSILAGHDFMVNKIAMEFGALYQFHSDKNFFFNIEDLQPSSTGANQDLTYSQNITSLYYKIRFPIKKLSVTINNRLDLSQIALYPYGIHDSRIDYFPNIIFYLPTAKAGAFSAAYNRQILLPSGDDLNPSTRTQTELNSNMGSSNINPQINEYYRLNQTIQIKKFSLSNTLSYEADHGLIDYGPYNIVNDALLKIKENLDKQTKIFLNSSVNWEFNTKLSFNGSIEYGLYNLHTTLQTNEPWKLNGNYYTLTLQADVTPVSGLRWHSALSYTDHDFTPFSKIYYDGPQLYTSINKSLFNKKMSVGFSISDLLNKGNNTHTNYTSPLVNGTLASQQQFRTFGFSLSYFFGNSRSIPPQFPDNKGIKVRDAKKAAIN